MRLNNILIILVISLLIGCSGKSSPLNLAVNPPDNDSTAIIGLTANDQMMNGLAIMGSYELAIDPVKNSAEIIPQRKSSVGESYIVSGAGFFTSSPCSKCFKIKSIALDANGNLVLSFLIVHPFLAGDPLKPPSGRNRLDLDIFDPAAVIAPKDLVPNSFAFTGTSAYAGFLVNADGYTTELAEVSGDNAAMPYVLAVDDSVSGNSTWNEFAMGAEGLFDMIFDLSNGGLTYNIYLTMGYGSSAKKAQRLIPTYYNPEFNRKAAWKVDVVPPNGSNPPSAGNTWTDSNSTGTYDVAVKVYDWQIGANVNPDLSNQTDIYAASGVSQVSVEIPGMYNSLKILNTPDNPSATGMPNDPLVYSFHIANENLLAAGKYIGLVKVSDERTPLSPAEKRDYLIHSPVGVGTENYNIPEYATYQAFNAYVVVGSSIQLTVPNGGEIWRVDSHHNVTWTTLLYTGNIKLEYSKDNFVSDRHPIIDSTPDTGTFDWQVPDDESTTVRVRATLVSAPTVHDDSDADFTIEKSTFEWQFDTVTTFYGGGYGTGFDDISPAIIEESDHEIMLTWAQTDTYHTYSGIDSVFRLRRSSDNGVTYQYEYYGDVGGDGLEREDNNKIAAGVQADAYAISAFLNNIAYVVKADLGYPNWGVFVTTPTRDQDVFVDSVGYIYVFTDEGSTIRVKHSQTINDLNPSNWSLYTFFPIAGSGYCSHVRSTDADSTNTVWLGYYTTGENQIKLAKSTGTSPYETWDSNTSVYSAGSGITQVRDPGLFIDSSDQFHICYTRYDSSTSKYQLVYTHDDSLFVSPPEQVIAESTSAINDASIAVGNKFGFQIIVFMWETNKSVYMLTIAGGVQVEAAPFEVDVNTDDIDPDVILDTDTCDLHTVWSTTNGTNYDIARRNAVLIQN